MADISTSQSNNSKFTAWSIGACPLVQAASAASEYGGGRRGHPGWTSQTMSLNSSLDFKVSQTNQVWQDWNSSRVIAGQRIREWAAALRWKSKGSGSKGCSRAIGWKGGMRHWWDPDSQEHKQVAKVLEHKQEIAVFHLTRWPMSMSELKWTLHFHDVGPALVQTLGSQNMTVGSIYCTLMHQKSPKAHSPWRETSSRRSRLRL